MDYKLVFDLQTSDIRLTNYLSVLPGVLIFLVGSFAYFYRDTFYNPFRTHPMPERLPFFLLLFGALWMQVTAFSLYVQYAGMQRAMETGRVHVAEGIVEQFEPMPYLGHGMEHFCVSGSDACFSYSDFQVTPGFNNSHSYGGPIQSGLPVRVTYKGNTILKLEIAPEHSTVAQNAGSGDKPPPEAALSPAR